MTTLTNGSRVYLTNIKATGKFIEHLTNGMARVELDSGRFATEYAVNVEALPDIKGGHRVYLKKNKEILGVVTRMINSLFAEVTCDKAVRPIVANIIRDIELLPDRCQRRYEMKAVRAAKAQAEAEGKRAKDKATKEARIAAQAVSKKNRNQKDKQKK